MVPVEPSSLRSDLVEPTKDDPEMLQRDTNNFNAINQCTHLCQEMCEKLLASPYFGKITFFGKRSPCEFGAEHGGHHFIVLKWFWGGATPSIK